MSTQGRSDDQHATATELVVALASAVQSVGLYPPGHPNREEVTTDVVVRVRRLAEAAGPGEDVPPLFVVRHAFYLGSSLLASASMDHGRLIAAFEDAGVGAVQFRAGVTPHDVDALLRILRGELTVTTPIPGLAVNQIEPGHAGATAASRGIGRSVDFARQTVASAYASAAGGRAPDVETVTRVARQLVSDVVADPDRAVLMAASGGARSLAARSVDTAIVAVAAARRLGRSGDELTTLAAGALLADVGLALLPPDVPHRHEPLTPEQRRLLGRHPVDGATLLLATAEGILTTAATIALQHHGRVDGGGYPQLGVGTRPTTDAQLVGIADGYTSLIRPDSPRRPAHPRHALATVLAERGRAWDPSVVDALVEVLGTYPIGSYVRLTSGEIGLVTAANRRLPDRPVVRVVQGADGDDGLGEERDTSSWDGFDFVWTIAGTIPVLDLTAVEGAPTPIDVGV